MIAAAHGNSVEAGGDNVRHGCGFRQDKRQRSGPELVDQMINCVGNVCSCIPLSCGDGLNAAGLPNLNASCGSWDNGCGEIVRCGDATPSARRGRAARRRAGDDSRRRAQRAAVDENRLVPHPQLVEALSHPNGWRRDTAQRLLVDRCLTEAVPPLKKLARESGSYLGRMHALWTLEGLGALDWSTVSAALRHEHPHVRVTALRVMDRIMTDDLRAKVVTEISALNGERGESSPEVLQQAIITLSAAAAESADFLHLLQLAAKRPDDLGRTAALTPVTYTHLTLPTNREV